MTACPTRWLIELGSAAEPTGLFMHVFEDGGFLWSRDITRALRFAGKSDAERYGFDHLAADFAVRARPAHELVSEADHVSEDEVDDDLAAS